MGREGGRGEGAEGVEERKGIGREEGEMREREHTQMHSRNEAPLCISHL